MALRKVAKTCYCFCEHEILLTKQVFWANGLFRTSQILQFKLTFLMQQNNFEFLFKAHTSSYLTPFDNNGWSIFNLYLENLVGEFWGGALSQYFESMILGAEKHLIWVKSDLSEKHFPKIFHKLRILWFCIRSSYHITRYSGDQ